jgi:hypothetical protein
LASERPFDVREETSELANTLRSVVVEVIQPPFGAHRSGNIIQLPLARLLNELTCWDATSNHINSITVAGRNMRILFSVNGIFHDLT